MYRLEDKDHEDKVMKVRSERADRTASIHGAMMTKTKSDKSSNFSKWMLNKGAEEKEMEHATTVVTQQKEKQKVDTQVSIMSVQSKKAAARIVKDIAEVRKLFFRYDEDQSGTIEFSEFLPLLAKLMRQPLGIMDSGEIARKWDDVDADGSGSITWDEFSTWYCETFNVEQVVDYRDFFCENLISEREHVIREVARSLGRDNVQIEKIYHEFNKLDDDGSGSLEYDEFAKLMIQNLSPTKDSPQVPKTVLHKFWIDVDADGSGCVSFPEFAAWYLKFFHGEISPMEQYYQMVGSGARRASCEQPNKQQGAGGVQVERAKSVFGEKSDGLPA